MLAALKRLLALTQEMGPWAMSFRCACLHMLENTPYWFVREAAIGIDIYPIWF